MKRIFVSAVALLLATAAVQAQSDTTRAPHREHHMNRQGDAYKQLNLSAGQQAKLKAMRDDFKQKRDALAAQKLAEEERRTQMQTLHQQQRTQIESILTPAQKEQLTKQRAEHKTGMRAGKKGDGMAARKGGMMKELNLTTGQQAKLKEMRTGFKTKAESLRNDQSLSDAQRKEKLQQLHQQQQEQLKTVLTKEQQEKMKSLRKEHAARDTK